MAPCEIFLKIANKGVAKQEEGRRGGDGWKIKWKLFEVISKFTNCNFVYVLQYSKQFDHSDISNDLILKTPLTFNLLQCLTISCHDPQCNHRVIYQIT